jgi:hypothetical protein
VKRTGHSPGRRRILASLLVFSLCLASGAVSKAEKSKVPKDVDEAEQWMRKDLETIGALEVQFHLDTGDLAYRTKDNKNFGFDLGRSGRF